MRNTSLDFNIKFNQQTNTDQEKPNKNAHKNFTLDRLTLSVDCEEVRKKIIIFFLLLRIIIIPAATA
jgi:hypothetical protein